MAQPKGANELERVTDVAAAPVVSDDQACAVAFQGRIACYDATKGTLQWSRDASSAESLAVDAVSVYMTDENGMVVAYDKASGATLWKQDKLLARGVSGPAVVGSLVVVGDYRGLRALPGAYRWRLRRPDVDGRQPHLGAAAARGQQRAGADARRRDLCDRHQDEVACGW